MKNYQPERDFQVGWEEMHKHARALAGKLLERNENAAAGWKAVAAVTRGGLIPAAIMAREFNIRIVDTISVESRKDYMTPGEVTIRKNLGAEARSAIGPEGEGLLVVDDLVDTGATFRKIREMFPKAFYAALYAKPEGRTAADAFFIEVSQDTWIYLPWDTQAVPAYVPPLSGAEGA